MRRSKAHQLLALVPVTLCLSCGGGDDDTGGSVQLGIHHDELRPECTHTIDEERTPYAMPQVLTAGWSTPTKLEAPLNTACPEDAVEISRDGSVLYFYWSPTVNGSFGELLHGTTGTYYSAKQSADPGSFGPARFFELRKGASDGGCDGELSFTPEGDYVYFHSTRAENTGYQASPVVDDPMDIYVAPVTDGQPGEATNLGEPVNSVFVDGEHCLSPDGTKLYVTSARPGGLGGSDIWVSTHDGTSWSPPVNLGNPINSSADELQPAFAANEPDTIYFVSSRSGAARVYRSTHDGTAWSEPEAMITGFVGEPSLTADGSVLYFVHVLVDDGGVFGSDIWYIERL